MAEGKVEAVSVKAAKPALISALSDAAQSMGSATARGVADSNQRGSNRSSANRRGTAEDMGADGDRVFGVDFLDMVGGIS